MNQFVVIGGNPRSGTNLARRVVGSHSQIAIPPAEFQLFKQAARGKSVEAILKNPRLEKWGVDTAPFYSEDPGVVFVGVLESYTQNAGKTIPGEKSPSNEFYYEEIKDALKNYDLKFIHMVRNPYDVMASYKHMKVMKGSSDLNDIRQQIKSWVDSVSLAIERTREDPEHCRLIRYEDLAGDPVTAARLLCEFIGVEFEERRMLGLTDFAEHSDNTSFSSDGGEGHAAYEAIKAPVSRKNYLSAAELRLVSISCGPMAMEAGYSDPDFSAYKQGGPIRRWFGALPATLSLTSRQGWCVRMLSWRCSTSRES